jgi:hypothetical protein
MPWRCFPGKAAVTADAGNPAGAPNRASTSGWCGIRSSGPMMSSASASERADYEPRRFHNDAAPMRVVLPGPPGTVRRIRRQVAIACTALTDVGISTGNKTINKMDIGPR